MQEFKPNDVLNWIWSSPYPDVMTPIRAKVRRAAKRRRGIKPPLEDDDLIRVATNLKRHMMIGSYRFTHVANESKNATERRRKAERGVQRGVSDLLIFVPFRLYERMFYGCAIELKRAWPGQHTKTDEQKAWIEQFRLTGWMAEFCEGYDEAQALIALCYG